MKMGAMSEADASSASCCPSRRSVDPWIVRFNERCDRFEHDLMELIDRRGRAQFRMVLATLVAVGGVIVAAIRL
jgi:hypothetical protein